MISLARNLLRHHNSFSCSCRRYLNSKIPLTPVAPPHTRKSQRVPKRYVIDDAMIEHLERLSLVQFGNREGIERAEEAIAFVSPLLDVDVEGVEPMYTVLDDQELHLRHDEVDMPENSRELILKNASELAEEDYFVAPPGNITLKFDPSKYKK